MPRDRAVGRGRDFSAGHDLSTEDHLAESRERNAGKDPFARGLMYCDTYTDSHLRWRDLPKPMIAMVDGRCIFGGWMIAAAMDILFAAEDALFIPTYGDYFTTAWDVGPRKAKELLFANRFVTAHEAMQWGFVNRIFSADRLESETLEYAGRVADQDPGENRLVKFAINQVQDGMGFTQAVRAVGAAFITRAYPRPGQPSPAARPAGSDPGGGFRDKVARAIGHLRREQAKSGDAPGSKVSG